MSHADASHGPIEELDTRTPMDGVLARRLTGENVMVQHLTVAKGAAAPMHHHENEQIMTVLSGAFRMTVQDSNGQTRSFTMSPGEILHLPPNCPHGGEAVEDCVILDIFSPPSESTGIDKSA